jgi:hypothetical protein
VILKNIHAKEALKPHPAYSTSLDLQIILIGGILENKLLVAAFLWIAAFTCVGIDMGARAARADTFQYIKPEVTPSPAFNRPTREKAILGQNYFLTAIYLVLTQFPARLAIVRNMHGQIAGYLVLVKLVSLDHVGRRLYKMLVGILYLLGMGASKLLKDLCLGLSHIVMR